VQSRVKMLWENVKIHSKVDEVAISSALKTHALSFSQMLETYSVKLCDDMTKKHMGDATGFQKCGTWTNFERGQKVSLWKNGEKENPRLIKAIHEWDQNFEGPHVNWGTFSDRIFRSENQGSLFWMTSLTIFWTIDLQSRRERAHQSENILAQSCSKGDEINKKVKSCQVERKNRLAMIKLLY